MTFAKDIHTFYDGAPKPTNGAKVFSSIDPASGEPVASIHTTSREELDNAVSSAKKAFKVWSCTPPAERSRILLKAVALLRERNDELALTETIDTGKPVSETFAVDVATGADVLEYYAKLVAGGMPGHYTRLRQDAVFWTQAEPLGVCAGIGAWNYPIQIALWKSAACLAAGNTMVYKPSEVTPLHANTLAQIYLEAGVPKGVFNVVYGDGIDVGAHLVAHPDVAKVSFTGQVSTGSKVASSAASGMKAVTMELGGKSPLIVLPDADIDEAADIAIVANFYSTGQVCTNGTRVFVPEEILPKFEAKLLKLCEEGIRMDLPQKSTTNFGPAVSAAHKEKVLSYIKHGKEVDQAKVLYDGSKTLKYPTEKGFWVPPVIFTNCTDNMKIVREEIFGPVMSILPYSTSSSDWVDKIVARANDTPMGLAAGVAGADLTLAQTIVQQLDAGITWINTWGESPAEMPVGGWKLSGIGLENGEEGLKTYTRNKSTLLQLSKGACAGVFSRI